MYNALNNIGYFSIYFQYLNCSEGIGLPPIGLEEASDGGPCGNGTWINGAPRL
jgi:hypothetical protein